MWNWFWTVRRGVVYFFLNQLTFSSYSPCCIFPDSPRLPTDRFNPCLKWWLAWKRGLTVQIPRFDDLAFFILPNFGCSTTQPHLRPFAASGNPVLAKSDPCFRFLAKPPPERAIVSLAAYRRVLMCSVSYVGTVGREESGRYVKFQLSWFIAPASTQKSSQPMISIKLVLNVIQKGMWWWECNGARLSPLLTLLPDSACPSLTCLEYPWPSSCCWMITSSGQWCHGELQFRTSGLQ